MEQLRVVLQLHHVLHKSRFLQILIHVYIYVCFLSVCHFHLFSPHMLAPDFYCMLQLLMCILNSGSQNAKCVCLRVYMYCMSKAVHVPD